MLNVNKHILYKQYNRHIILVCTLASAIGYPMVATINRSHFYELWALFTVLFALYYLVYKLAHGHQQILYLLLAAMGFRLCLLFTFPNLSDDIYRFIWDGRLLVNGLSPFAFTPTQLLDGTYTGNAILGIDNSHYVLLNSPNYFTIYPPVCQAVFYLSAWFAPTNIQQAAMCMKGFLWLTEGASIYFLYRLLLLWQMPLKYVLLYALNPLVIVEIVGNIHFEGAMICFLLGAIYAYTHYKKSTNRYYLWASALAMALAVNAKLLPLMFLPFFIRRLSWKNSFTYFFIVGSVSVLAFMPILNLDIVLHLMDSVGLYFQKFEFNASIYYLVRYLGYQYTGYNVIQVAGASLGVLAFIGILGLAYREKYTSLQPRTLPLMFLAALSIYLAVATIVHPWYVCTLVALAALSSFRFPIIWAYLVTLTYYTYLTDSYTENLYLVTLEYLLVYAFLIYELGHRKLLFKPI